ncbi:MAG: DUF72 domain-containing protein [Elusimicrobia bacterium]|nr:DUF72 domain-containing protein [Elusimicrobiota bacterium]
MEGRIHVGTSGYVYGHWRGVLYPAGLSSIRWLPRYAEAFSTVELNNTFYRLPETATVSRWRSSTPADFVFCCKGSRYLTHIKRLNDARTGLNRFYGRVRYLGSKLRLVLWQLPPTLKPDHGRLESFLKAQPRDIRQAVEFRNALWYTKETCEVLERHGAAFCEHDHFRERPPELTGGWRYLGFHGKTGRYRGRYGSEGLAPYARGLKHWRKRGRDAYVYFNNDVHGDAVFDALALLRLLGQPSPLGLENDPELSGARR